MLESAVNAKDDYISMLTHDMKNPIMAISSSLELQELKQGGKGGNKLTDIISSSALQLQTIVDDISKLALETQTQNWSNKTPVYIKEFVDVAASYSFYLSEKKNVEMEIIHDNQDICILTNRTLLLIALRNIISNAVKFSYTGDVIKIVTSASDGAFTIRICDQGRGMQQDKINNILKCKNVDSTMGTAGESGSGIGLVNSIKIIKLLNGTIRIYSELGKGTEVLVTLVGAVI